jgi:hypothetical protein
VVTLHALYEAVVVEQLEHAGARAGRSQQTSALERVGDYVGNLLSFAAPRCAATRYTSCRRTRISRAEAAADSGQAPTLTDRCGARG